MRVFTIRSWQRWVLLLAAVAVASFLGRAVYQPVVDFASVATGARLLPIYRVGTDQKKLSISFDATWGTDLTDEILDILAEHNIYTTFFLAGNWLDKYPEYVVKIAAAGHEIGNHSYSHPHMSSLSYAGVVRELEKNHALIRSLTGSDPYLFRPPFGEYNNTVIEAANALGYYTIQWSIDSLDWKNTTSDEIYERVLHRAGPGEIILFHNAARPTPDAIRRIIPALLEQDYQIVPISQLIWRTDYVIEHDGTQRAMRGRSGP